MIPDERSLRKRFQKFARFLSHQEYEEFISGLLGACASVFFFFVSLPSRIRFLTIFFAFASSPLLSLLLCLLLALILSFCFSLFLSLSLCVCVCVCVSLFFFSLSLDVDGDRSQRSLLCEGRSTGFECTALRASPPWPRQNDLRRRRRRWFLVSLVFPFFP